MDKERFSLLLLEPNEIYFEDFLVDLLDNVTLTRAHSTQNETHVNGHLKMCSKSIVFDPKNTLVPIIKISFKDCSEIYQWTSDLHSKYVNVLAIRCSQYIEMLAQNILAPYSFKTENRLFLFKLRYARVEHYLNQLCQLMRASTLTAFEQNDMIAAIVYSRYKRVKFDPLWLDDIYEKTIIDCIVDEINPLVLNPGRLLLTSNCTYFQPYNNIRPYPVQKIPLKSIRTIVKRRFLLRHTGLEINWTLNGAENQLYVSFRNESERNQFYQNAHEQEALNPNNTQPESMTLKWQNGLISNFEYLIYLNSLADRTFQDLTQYPVFPWVISNYTSAVLDLSDENNYRDLTKPIGALSEERLLRLKERTEEMDEPKFLYGSHYSAPALVLFYLVRKFPRLMLCLQNGRFDHPDRMFNDVKDVYKNCLTNMADFKELIPEFYDTSQKGDFLLNKYKIAFGSRHDGAPVNHVQLPPWADGSAEIFVQKLRDALESDYVSRNLNYWIDLIFGYKQRGNEAAKADNLFHPLCYEGAVDLDKVKDLTERHALEVQISEFGQIPKQLFDTPHVPKIMTIPTKVNENQLDAKSNIDDVNYCDIRNVDLDFVLPSHKDVIYCILNDGNNIFAVGKDGLLKGYSIQEKRQIRSVSLCGLPLSSCVKIRNTNIVVVGSFDNSIMTYDLDYGRVSNVIPAHDDTVSCLSILNEIGMIVSGSWDCSVKVWKGFDQTEKLSFRMSDSLIAYLSLEEKISTVHAMLNDKTISIAIGTFNGEVMLWSVDLNNLQSIDYTSDTSATIITKHVDEVTAVQFNKLGTKIVSCGLDCVLHVCDVKTGMTLFRKQQTYALMCLDWSHSEQYLLVGDQGGNLSVWDMFTGSIQLEINAFKNIVSGISYSNSNRKIAVAGIDGRDFCVKVWNCN